MWKKLICLTSLVFAMGLIPGSAALAASVLSDPDLIAWWTFDEGSGTLAADSSANGHDATVNGGAQWIPGIYGSALEFDGTDDYVGTDGSFFTGLGQFTIACWLAGDLSGASRTGLVGQNDCIEYGFISSNTIQIWTPGGGSLNVAWPYTDLDWHHIVAVGDGSSLTVYIDGEQAGTGGSTTNSYGTSTFNVNIGGGGVYDGTGNWFTGKIDDVAVFSRGLSAEEVLVIIEGVVSPELAADPNPNDDETDVGRDTTLGWTPGESANTHNVYLGISFDDVNDASVADPGGVLVGQGLADATFDPGRFEFGQSHYWRVDEVNSAPDFTVFKGDVWSFTVEPFSIPIDNITATASSSFGASAAEKTIDGSGLVGDLHGTAAGDMWISGGVPATIEYAFDRAYKLHELWIWNSNQLIEAFVGFGAKDVVIEHSLDGENWTVLEGVGPLARATGTEGDAHNNTIDFGGATAQHVRITVNSVQGIAPQASLSEVRFYYMPTFATQPNPSSDATDVAPDTSLSWGRNGREADRHEVLIGSDPASLSSAGTVTESSLDTQALDLQLSQSYHWRVDEINDVMVPSRWEGTLWSFTTADAIVIDDMESYADEEFREIWATWVDGFDDPANGSFVGTGPAGTPETGIVHGGRQSLPMEYDNSAAAQSEATRTFAAAMDWTRHGVQSLSLYFRGDSGNSGGQLYVKINDTKIPYDGDAGDLGRPIWLAWNIDLSTVAGGVSSVRSLAVGVEGAGATGVVYVDSVSLYAGTPQFIVPTEPDVANLVARYTFDGNANDSSGNGHHGTPIGAITFVNDPDRGQVVGLPGGDDQYISIEGVGISGTMPRTIACWAKADNTVIPNWTLIFGFTGTAAGGGGGGSHFNIGSLGGPGGVGAHVWGWEETIFSDEDALEWHHYAMSYDGTTIRYYGDGVATDTDLGKSNVRDLSASSDRVHVGSRITQTSSFPGNVDDAVIYSGTLTDEEIAWLAGRTVPMHKGF